MKAIEKVVPLEYVRCFACLLVILLHVCAYYINFYGKINVFYWNIANIIESFTRICVPLFFMVSGFLFMSEKKPKIRNYIRLLTSLLFYSGIALILFVLAKKLSPSSILMEKFTFFNQPSFYHLWFLYPMFGVYLFSHFISVKNLNIKYSSICVLFIFLMLNPKLNDISLMLFGLDISNLFMIDGIFVYYFLYGISGALIGNLSQSCKLKVNCYILLLLIFISLFFTSYLNKLTYDLGIERKISFYDFTSPLIFVMASSVFIFIFSVNFFKKERRWVSIIADNSLCIYGIHAFILAIIKKIIDYKLHNPLLLVPIIFILVLMFSIIFAKLLRKVDKGRYFS